MNQNSANQKDFKCIKIMIPKDLKPNKDNLAFNNKY